MEKTKLITGQFNDTFVPIMDGVGLVARNYAKWLNRKYGKGFAVAPKVPGYKEVEDFPVLRFASLPLPGKDPWRLGIPKLDPKFKKELMSIDFDIMHTHCPFTSAEIALKVAGEKNIPLVTTFHSKYRDDFEKNLKANAAVQWAMNKIIRFYHAADYVWVPNAGTKATLRDYGFTGDIEVMVNGTDLDTPSEQEFSLYRKQGGNFIGCDDSVFVYLFVGQHRWIKNIKLILDAVKILLRTKKEFLLVFVGTGSDENEIKKTVSEEGLENHVLFKGRVIDRDIMKCYYARADLFLFPSLYDTASLVMREAAAFRNPSVLIRGSSTSEGITHGENGFLSENNPEDYAGILKHLMENPGLIRKAGEGAKKSIYLPWEKVVDKVYVRYKEIINEYRRKSPG